MATPPRARILVLGGGFGGLFFVKALRAKHNDIVLVDRQNHHLFQPLLYQVATAGLAAPQIAQPIRQILSGRKNLRVLLGEVEAVDLKSRTVRLAGRSEPLTYDYLVYGLGVVNDYFGHSEWARHARGMKSLEDAAVIRRDLLLALEAAESSEDPDQVRRLLTVVVIGGGPTGVELAGAIADLVRHARRDFTRVELGVTRVVLVEKGPRLLAHLPEDLSASAERQLASLGVEVRTNVGVADITAGRVQLDDGTELLAETILWAAGVRAAPSTVGLGVPLDRAGRLEVLPDLSLPGHPEAFAVGDAVSLVDPRGVRVPGVSPAAMQMGAFVAREISARVAGAAPSGRAFVYRDKGSMATIGRKSAVAHLAGMKLSGFPAWITWLVVHLLFLIGFRNKLQVVVNWISSYLFYRPGARVVSTPEPPPLS
ncbi:MAG: NAD(P)/FAD-dependent oxidoreductase [Thermoanaerobaculia bacterium]|nr:NAD(P)/FAD-dependent oxidoreductase [Thermoanaerobaculia bacterium]